MITLALISNLGLISIAFIVGIVFVLVALALCKRAADRRDAQSNRHGFQRMREHERNQRWCF